MDQENSWIGWRTTLLKKSNLFIVGLFILTLFFIFQDRLRANTIKEAKIAYSKRNFAKAIKLFKSYSSANPSSGEPYMYMGYIYESQKNYPQSIQMFQRAVDLKLPAKKKLTCYLKIILFYKYLRAWNHVIHYSNRYLTMSPNNKNIIKIRSKAYAQRGKDTPVLVYNKDTKKEETKKDDKKITKEHSKETSHKNTSLAVKTEKNKTKKKEETVVINTNKKKVSERPKVIKKEKPVKKVVNKKKNHIAEKKSVKVKDLEYYNKLLSQKPEDESALWSISLIHFVQKEYTLADKYLSFLNEKHPSDKMYLYKHGVVKLRLGKHEEAIDKFRKSLRLTDESDVRLLFSLHLNMGKTYFELKDNGMARAHFEQALQFKEHSGARIAICKIDYTAARYENALKSTDLILKETPDETSALMYRGLSQLHMKKEVEGYKNLLLFEEKVLKSYNPVTSIPTEYHESLFYLSNFYFYKSDYESSSKYLYTIEEMYKNSLEYLFLKGRVHFHLKNYTRAILDLEKLSDNSEALYYIAKSYAALKNFDKLKEFLKKAADKKESYWKEALSDKEFGEYLSQKKYQDFIGRKGIEPEVKKNEQVTKSNETKEVKLENKTEDVKKEEKQSPIPEKKEEKKVEVKPQKPPEKKRNFRRKKQIIKLPLSIKQNQLLLISS